MDKDKQNSVTLALLVLIVVINLFLWSNTRYLKGQVTRLQAEMHDLRTHVAAEVAGISNTVQSMHDDARWWTPATIDFHEIDGGTALVQINWQLREYRPGSAVALNYQPVGETGFTAVPAEEQADGYFSAVVPVQVPLEPLWYVSLNRTTADSRPPQPRVQVVEDSMIAGHHEPSLRYYISMQDGETARTSEIRNLGLAKLSFNLFNPLHLNLNLRGDEITATLHEQESGSPRFKLQRVYLETRQGHDRILDKWRLEPAALQNGQPVYEVSATASGTFDSLYVVAEYSGGLVAEKQIPLR